MPKVVVVGDANVDVIVPYPRFLNEERTQVEYPQIGIQGGGTSANTAVALAKLGLDVSFVGTVGDDQYGRFVMQDFKDAGVDVTGLVADSTLSTVGVFAFVDDRGERYLWGWPRERQSFKVLDENLVPMHMIREADWVHSSGMCLTYDTSARETIIRIFEQAHDAGVPTRHDGQRHGLCGGRPDRHRPGRRPRIDRSYARRPDGKPGVPGERRRHHRSGGRL